MSIWSDIKKGLKGSKEYQAGKAKRKAVKAKKKEGKTWTKAVKAQKKAGGKTMNELIKARNAAEKGSEAYATAQNKINKAYDYLKDLDNNIKIYDDKMKILKNDRKKYENYIIGKMKQDNIDEFLTNSKESSAIIAIPPRYRFLLYPDSFIIFLISTINLCLLLL